MIIIDCEQRSPEWFQARCGLLTGSHAQCILAKGKGGGEAVTRANYRMQLVCERLTGVPTEEGFNSQDMKRGAALEPKALAALETSLGFLVSRSGFVRHEVHKAGCSVDGQINAYSNILEIKCPKTTTHIEYRDAGRIPPEYVRQITHNLWVTGADHVTFVSFDDRLPEHLQMFVICALRSEFDIALYEEAALEFLDEVERDFARLSNG